ncbi:YceI family protein [Erythrobacter sp. JK5]|uniref:YceI family protein n=1 Tax=Erythrobacter sp. JK5 TaxID=2829500 RepID=UPI002012FE9F|nr:YceI family protein [Erythrobacter sp. JK5]
MPHTIRILAASALLALAACQQAPAEAPPLAEGTWTVDSDASRLNYVSVKSGEIAENNHFTGLSGSVAPDGAATVEIDLATVSTGVDIRNERMREIFFNVAEFPKATITAQVDPAAFEALAVGESTTQPLKGTLSVKGAETAIDTEVDVTRVSADRVLVASKEPVIVYADALDLTEGLAQLQQLAGLPSITPAVPVTFSIAFER